MNNDLVSGHWEQIKNHIQSRWGKFTNHDLEALKHDLDSLSGKIQKVYGYSRAQSEREYHEFRISLLPLLRPAVKAPSARS